MTEEKKTCEHKTPAYNKETNRFYCKDCGKKEGDDHVAAPKEDNWKWKRVFNDKYPQGGLEHKGRLVQTEVIDFIESLLVSQKKEQIGKVKEFSAQSRAGKYWNAEAEKAYQAGVSTMENKMLSYLSDTK